MNHKVKKFLSILSKRVAFWENDLNLSLNKVKHFSQEYLGTIKKNHHALNEFYFKNNEHKLLKIPLSLAHEFQGGLST